MINIQGFINDLANLASEISLKYFRQNFQSSYKQDISLVTEADLEIEKALIKLISQTYPDHGIISEETVYSYKKAKYEWVIDPIDGTTAFAAGKLTFTNLIGLLEDGKPIFGLINQPFTKERWFGDGTVAYFNGQKILPTKANKNPILNTTTPEMFKTSEEKAFFDFIRSKVKTVSYGGDAYTYGLLALGFVDIILESDLKIYDLLPLVPILTACGRRVCNWNRVDISTKADFNGKVLAYNQDIKI